VTAALPLAVRNTSPNLYHTIRHLPRHIIGGSNPYHGRLSRYKAWWRFNCGFAGCRARVYVCVLDGDDSALYVVQCAHEHVHMCAPCVAHECAPCDTCAAEGIIPGVIPAVTGVAAGSVYAQAILYETQQALRDEGGNSNSPFTIHAWQLEHIATQARVRDGSWQGLKSA